MEADFKERVRKFAASQGLSVKGLQDELGLSNAHFSNTNKITPKVGAKLLKKYPNVSIDWLNFGVGAMYNDAQSTAMAVSTLVPLVPVAAMAGRLTEFQAQVHEYDCEMIVSPTKDAQLAITVSGDSMSPEYPNGSIVFISRINEKAFIEWGKTFVLDTANGVIIKKLFPSTNGEDRVVCRSINPNYSDFEVKKEDVFSWYIVRLQMATK